MVAAKLSPGNIKTNLKALIKLDEQYLCLCILELLMQNSVGGGSRSQKNAFRQHEER